jgi:hypothetical protein
MRRFAVAALGALLCLPAQAALAQSGVGQPAAVKGDREKLNVKRPPGLQDREDIARPAAKPGREDSKQPAVTAEPVEHPVAKPTIETQAPAKLSRHKAIVMRHRRAYARHNVAVGSDAQVLRARRAWLRALAHKYGFSHW